MSTPGDGLLHDQTGQPGESGRSKTKAARATPKGANPYAALVATHKVALTEGAIITLPSNRFLISQKAFEAEAALSAEGASHLITTTTVDRVIYRILILTPETVATLRDKGVAFIEG